MSEEEYWNWFQENASRIETFLHSDKSDMSVYEELTNKTNEYHELVSPEVTRDKNGTFVLVLTCDGNPDGVYHVQKLGHVAPEINGWRVQQFRQHGQVKELEIDGLHLTPKDFLFNYWTEEDKHSFDMYIKGFQATDKRYESLAFLYLDHFIGEFELMTEVATIGFKKLNLFTKKRELINFSQLQGKIHNSKK